MIALDTFGCAGKQVGRISFTTNRQQRKPFNFTLTGTINKPGTPGGGGGVTATVSGGTLTVTAQSAIDTFRLALLQKV